MSPITAASGVPVQPTQFLSMPSSMSGITLPTGFPPTIADFQRGITSYRASKGADLFNAGLRYQSQMLERILVGQTFTAGGEDFRVGDATVHMVAGPLYDPGNVEMNPHLLIPPLAAMVGAYPYMGKGNPAGDGGQLKKDGDGEATEAERSALDRMWMDGSIKGGESWRDNVYGLEAEETGDEDVRLGFSMGERNGTRSGFPMDFYIDSLEVTNGVLKFKDGAQKGWNPAWAGRPETWPWFFSGTGTLMLAADGRNGGGRLLFDGLYFDHARVGHRAARSLRANRIDMRSPIEEWVGHVAEAEGINPKDLIGGVLARGRHMPMIDQMMAAGMSPWNFITPTDGDSAAAFALGAGAMQLWRGTGGPVEGLLSGAFGIPFGIQTQTQFVSHDQLRERRGNANMLDPEQRTGFSPIEIKKMYETHLFDSQNVEGLLRVGGWDSDIVGTLRRSSHFVEGIKGYRPKLFFNELLRIVKKGEDIRFSDSSREFVVEALKKNGFLDVQEVQTFGTLIRKRDWLAVFGGISDSRFAPIVGMTKRGNSLAAEMIVVGGSHAVYVLEVLLNRVT
ncbi:MAG: fructose-bisphosphatase class II [Deltaproteobacteria bacterium]|jgi:fructose-1,6-bisphosphatase/sedoheptulose 1,7-bisphosphatase-like protein|nr:fructose-bisphosphatase class II [Deltaproteobacteria bacterium]